MQALCAPEDFIVMNIATKLKRVSDNPNKEKLVKYYLIDCCEKLIRFRSNSRLPKNILIARKFLKGFATQKQIHQAEWEQEGEAFGVEYYSEKGIWFYFRAKKEVSADLVKVRISKGLTNQESRKYLENMAYFIDHVFCHIEYTSNWLFTEQCEQFLCPRLYSKYFGTGA
jgi:hypothetical protein